MGVGRKGVLGALVGLLGGRKFFSASTKQNVNLVKRMPGDKAGFVGEIIADYNDHIARLAS